LFRVTGEGKARTQVMRSRANQWRTRPDTEHWPQKSAASYRPAGMDVMLPF